jgi:uncharacterized repeat protein (TIGR03803 family)
MLRPSWLRSSKSIPARPRTPSRRRSHRLPLAALRPLLEPLEGRTLLSVDVLATFNGSNGTSPYTNVVEDGSGNLFGTTLAGGDYGDGTVFEVKAGSNTITTLASFDGSDGNSPIGGVVLDGAGNMFGVTTFGGTSDAGTVFEVPAGGGSITTLVNFDVSNGANPHAALLEDGSGDLFGTTGYGGAAYDPDNDIDGYGTVFEVTGGNLTTLASFAGSDGVLPYGTLIEDSSGDLFGTTTHGGTTWTGDGPTGDGTVFEVEAGGDGITDLASFDGSAGTGVLPYEGLVADSGGNLFGTTTSGGAAGDGTVFEVAADGGFTTLASFNGTDGGTPSCAPLDINGDLLGTVAGGGANSDGTVWELAAGSDNITTVDSFDGSNGQYGIGNLIADSNDNLFGVTDHGGASGDGTVFEIPYSTSTDITDPADTYGSDATVTVTVSSDLLTPVPTGDVSLTVGNGAPIVQALVNGASTFDISGVHAGVDSLTASYAAQGGFPASSGAGTLTVNPYAFTYTIPPVSQTYGTPANFATALGTTIDTGVNGENLNIVYSSTGDTDAADVATYPITGTLSNGTGQLSDYDVTLNNGTLAVKPYYFTYTIPPDSQTYGTPANFATDLGTTIETGVNFEDLSISYTSTGDTATAHAGTYDISAQLSDGATGLLSDYQVSVTLGTLTVKPYTFAYQLTSSSQIYGAPINFANALGTIIFTHVNGQNLSISYSSTGDTDTADVGAYPITATLSDGTGLLSDYSVNFFNSTLTVNPYAFTYTIENDHQKLGGPAADLAADLPATIDTGVNDEDLSIAYSSTGDVDTASEGTYPITGTVSDGTGLLSDYNVTLNNGTLTVAKYFISYTIPPVSQTYGTPADFATVLGTTIDTGVDGQTLSISYSSTGDTGSAHAGTYAITATLSDGSAPLSDYGVTLTNGMLTVNPYAFAYTILPDIQVYGTPANFAQDKGPTIDTGVNGENLNISFSSPGDTATAHVNQTGYPITAMLSSGTGMLSDYNVTLNSDNATLFVKPCPITYTIGNDSQTYGGPAADLAGDLGTTIPTGVNDDRLSISYGSTGDIAAAHAGTYAITGTLSDSIVGMLSDYSVTLNDGTLTVKPYAFTYTIQSDVQTYGTRANFATDLGATIPTGVNGENLNIVYSSEGDTTTAHVNQAGYPITGTLSDGTGQLSDYDVTLNNGTLTVNPYALTYTIQSDSQTYGTPADFATDLGTTIDTGVNGENLNIGYSSAGDTTTAHVNQAGYPITGTLSDGTGQLSDYKVTLNNGKLTVDPYAFTYTIQSDSQTYGTRADFATDLGTTIDTGVNGENLNIVYSSAGDATTAHVNQDGYAITGTLSDGTGQLSDYKVTLNNGTLTVNQAKLTITANNQSMIAGQPLPSLTASYSGFVNGEGPASLTRLPTLSTTTTLNSPGTYPITAGGAVDPNYMISYVAGTLSVSPPLAVVIHVTIDKIKTGKKTTKEVIELQFSEAMNTADAQNLASYSLVTVPKSKKQKGTALALAKASYNLPTSTVTLTTRKALVLSPPITLTVKAAGLLDALGRPLDGGGNFVATLSKNGATVTSAVPLDRASGLSGRAVDAVLGAGFRSGRMKA